MKRICTLLILTVFALCASAQEGQTASRPRIAIFDCLTKSTAVNEDTKIAVRETISAEVVKGGMYDVVERSLLEQVMKEQGFQYSGVVDESQITEIGKITGANKIILPVVTSPAENMFMLSIKLLDVKTGNVERQETSELLQGYPALFEEARSMTSLVTGGGGTKIRFDF